jgi:DinB superfamily
VKGKVSAQSIDPDELIANYGSCPNQLEAAILGLSEVHLDIRKAAESWTIREVIHHIADGDDMWKLFIKRAIGNSNGEYLFDWYWQVPQDEWAKRWSYKERLIEPSLALFRANRSHIVQLLRHTPGALEKSLRVRWPTALGEQDVKVRLIVEGQTQHALAHIAEIREIREAHGV